jgi:hypothetical protein
MLAGASEGPETLISQSRIRRFAAAARGSPNHIGLWPRGHGIRDSNDRLVQQPLLVSLSLLNKRHWNHDIIFRAGEGGSSGGAVGRRSAEAGEGGQPQV